METDAHLCLLTILASLVALTAEGFPANSKVMPSPHWRNSPPTHRYPHRKLSRPWLVKLQEELWRDGPSGDGPGEDAWSSLIAPDDPAKAHVSKTAVYKTTSPSAQDFSSSPIEPFPTVIDTMMDDSSSFEDEFISRTSMSYEGPSSLLNSFIFRPSVPLSSPSSVETPSLEDSRNILPSWMEESSATFKRSHRQAVSETVSDYFVIITAISATHIYTETVWIPGNNPDPLLSDIISDLRTDSSHIEEASVHPEVPSRTNHLSPVYSERSSFYTTVDSVLTSPSWFDHTNTFMDLLTPESQMLRSSDIPVDHPEVNINSDTFNRTEMPHILSHNYSYSFYNTPNLPSSKDMLMTTSSSEKTTLVDRPFFTQILYDSSSVFYTKTPFKSFLSSNVKTVVSVTENAIDDEKFIFSTLSSYETSSPIDYDVQKTVYTSNIDNENASSQILPSFSDASYIIPVISIWPMDDVTSVENIISHEDTNTFLNEFATLEDSGKFHPPSNFNNEHTSTISDSLSDVDNEITHDNSSRLVEENDINSERDKVIRTNIPSFEEQDQNDIPSKERNFLLLTIESSFNFISHTKPGESETELSPEYHGSTFSRTAYKHQSYPSLTSDFLQKSLDSTFTFKSFPHGLSPSVNVPDVTTTSTSVPDILSMNSKTSYGIDIFDSYGEFIDPSTHHVTVRSLSDSSAIDVGESLSSINHTSSVSSDIDAKISVSRPISSSVTIASDYLEYKTKLANEVSSLTETFSIKYIPDNLESSFASYEDQNRLYESKIFDSSMSKEHHETHSILLTASDVYFSLPVKEISSRFTPEIDDYSSKYFNSVTESVIEHQLFSIENEASTLSFSDITRTKKSTNSDNVFLASLDTANITSSKNTMLHETPQFTPLHSLDDNIHEQSTPVHTYESETLTSNEEVVSGRSASLFTSTNLEIEPTKTYPYAQDSNEIEKIFSHKSIEWHLVSNEKSVDGNTIHSESKIHEVDIQSSMDVLFPDDFDAQKSWTVTLQTGEYTILETPLMQTEVLDKSVIFTPRDYLSEPLLDISDRITRDSTTTTNEHLDDYFPTRSLQLELTKYIDYSSAKIMKSTEDFFPGENGKFESYDPHASAILASGHVTIYSSKVSLHDSEITGMLQSSSQNHVDQYSDSKLYLSTYGFESNQFFSLPYSLITPELSTRVSLTKTAADLNTLSVMSLSYTESLKNSALASENIFHSEIRTDYLISPQAFNSDLATESELKFYPMPEKTLSPLLSENGESVFDKLHSEIHKTSDLLYVPVSSLLHQATAQQRPSYSAIVYEKPTPIAESPSGFPSQDLESSILYAPVLSFEDITQTYYETLELTPSHDVTLLKDSSMIRGLYTEKFPDSTPSFTIEDASISYENSDWLNTLPTITHSSLLMSYYDIIPLVTREISPLDSNQMKYISTAPTGIISASISEMYHITELSPSYLLTKSVKDESLFTRSQHPDIKDYSELGSRYFESSGSYLQLHFSSEETNLNLATPSLRQDSECEIFPCIGVKTTTDNSHEFEMTSTDSDLIEALSPTMHLGSGSGQVANTSELLSRTFDSYEDSVPTSPIDSYTVTEPRRITESDSILITPVVTSLHSDRPLDKTKGYSEHQVKVKDPENIDSDLPFKKLSSRNSDLLTAQLTVFPTKTMLTSISAPYQSQTLTPVDSIDHTSVHNLGTASPSDVTSASPSRDIEAIWPKEISTASHDTEMASVLAISSSFGANSTRNTSSGVESGEMPQNDSAKSEVVPTPSLDLTLFKDNNYWILTVLEAPVRGQLPENFGQTLEQRLANAYSEAFRTQKPKREGPEETVVVKILSLTNDLLLSQLNVVYVVERGGVLVLADVASKILNYLRHEQLREFLGLYTILKAKPYRPEYSPDLRPVSTGIPVVTIVCSILGLLLLLFCCFCVYCRCCRPKGAAEASPTSSTSGSLQRSLAKHGQHNRKHLFREMAHHLTTEVLSHGKQESPARDLYLPEKEPPPLGKKLPPLPPTDQAEAVDRARNMLGILEGKDDSHEPATQKSPKAADEQDGFDDSTMECKKSLPKQKKERKSKALPERREKSSRDTLDGVASDLRPLPKDEVVVENNRASPDSGTSSRHTSSSSPSEKTSEEPGSDGSNAELLPPLQDLIAKSKADSEAAAADTQIHLSRVRQRISELLDDAFALANGRKFYGSLRSKKIDPATEMFPRYASLRSQSAAECSLTRHEESPVHVPRRPISEGAQRLLGAITDDGQLITKPPPKVVWDHNEPEESIADKHQEVTEAHNRHVNFFPFQQQSKFRQISASSTSSLPVLDTLQESQMELRCTTKTSSSSIDNLLGESASDVFLAHSSKIHPAAADQYDEIDVVSALREGEPVGDLIQAIKDELQKFSGTMPATNSNESNA